jgi:hypothetical protein
MHETLIMILVTGAADLFPDIGSGILWHQDFVFRTVITNEVKPQIEDNDEGSNGIF